jgi:flagellar hook assembly protein FlgD
LPDAGKVKLQVFDILGRMVNTLVNEQKAAGSNTVEWNGSHLSSGTYFLRLLIKDTNQKVVFDQTKKILLTK